MKTMGCKESLFEVSKHFPANYEMYGCIWTINVLLIVWAYYT